MIMSKKRLIYIDACKAIGILLVLLGHTYNLPRPLYLAIYAFHMPLFFILSGFVHRNNESIGFFRYALDKAKRLLIPYFLFAFINLAIEFLWKTVYVKEALPANYLFIKLKGILLCYSNTENMPNCSPIWFLVCLFIASLVFWWLIKLQFRFSAPIVLALGTANYLLLPLCRDHTSFPFKFPTFLLAACFLYIGYYLKLLFEKPPKFLTHPLWPALGAILVFGICSCWVILTDNLVGMNENAYSNYLIFSITSVLMSAAFICLMKTTVRKTSPFWTFLGKNTLYIMGFNYVFRDIATELYYFTPYLRNHPIHWTVSFALTTAIALLFLLILTRLKRIFVKKST